MVADMKQKHVGKTSDSDLVGRASWEVTTESAQRGPRPPSVSPPVRAGELKDRGLDATTSEVPGRRHESWQTVQVVLGVVGGALGLIAAAIGVLGPRGEDGPAPISNDIDTPSSSIRGEDTRLPSPINEILAELQVSEENWAFIEGLTERFVDEASNPTREEVVEYIRLKEGVISQVGFVARREGQVGTAGAASVDLAFRQGDIHSIESLVSAEQGDEVVGPMLRAHMAILIDQPQTARVHFERVAAGHAEGDARMARYVLADGGDNLLGLGCVLGLEWLDAAIGLYGGSLQGWAVDEEPLERAITQNNLGVAVLLMGMEDAYGGDASAMLRRSVDALAQASEVFMFQGERQDTNAAIVYTNSEQANWELLALDPGNLELLENHAVAESGVIAVQTRALASGGPRSVEQLDDRRRSMQIVSTRQDTGAQRLRLTGDRDFCRRPL